MTAKINGIMEKIGYDNFKSNEKLGCHNSPQSPRKRTPPQNQEYYITRGNPILRESSGLKANSYARERAALKGDKY